VIALAATFLVALIVSTLVTPRAIALAERHGVVRKPGERDVHTQVTPLWGGMGIYAGAVVAVLLSVSYRHWRTEGVNGWTPQLIGLLLGATWIAAAGAWDDRKGLSPAKQVLAILIGAAIVLAFGVRIEGISNPLSGIAGYWRAYEVQRWLPLSLPASVLATLAWFVGVTKTVDIIDGLDGLAAGVCAISATTLALLATVTPQPGGPALGLVAASIAGACIGFLRFNFNPAKVFMGTIGAQFLGFMLAGIAVLGPFKAAAAVSVLIPLLVMGMPVFDGVFVVLRRLVTGQPLTQADKRHFHHWLLDRGLTQRQAVYVIYAMALVFCAVALLLFTRAIPSS